MQIICFVAYATLYNIISNIWWNVYETSTLVKHPYAYSAVDSKNVIEAAIEHG